MKITTLLISFVLICLNSYGQVLKGNIMTKGGQDFVPFANILVEGTQVGTVSNQEGKFELTTEKLAKEFTLVISVIGFKTSRIKVDKTTTPNLTIELEENVIELDEVVFKYLSAEEIFNNFHKNYTSNYYQGSSVTKAFYHSTLAENGEYKHLLEATVVIREFSKKKHRAFEVEMTQRRKSNDYRLERWGEKNNYLYDAIANNPMLKLSGFLALKNQKEYKLTRLANTSYNNELIYVLQFVPKDNSKKALFTAKAYFNANDFALIKAEYDFQNDKLKIRNQSLKEKTYHTPFISGSLQYQKIGKYYTQKYLSYTNGWTVINHISKDTLAKDVLRDEILFLETELDNATPLSNPLSKWGDIFKRPFAYDSQYWSKQVKLPPTQLIKKAIKDLEEHQSIEIQYFTNSANAVLNQKFANSLSGKIDSVLTVYHLTNLFNGVALVTNQNQIIHHKAYGYADLENKIALDTATVFDIGSITKQFTTAMILKLREKGKLKLTDKIGKYLPKYRYADKVTIHQLLAHRTGIPTFDYQDTLENSKWFTSKMETEELITSFCSGDLEFEPNSKMEYSNSNFLILTAIIEKIEKKDYYSLVDELIFKPLKLSNSYRPDSLPSQNVAKGYILDGTNYISEPKWKKQNMKGGGCIYSTSGDLLSWINATNSTKLLNQEDKKLIKSPISYYEYYDSNFGYSWGINTTLFKTSEPTYFYGGTSLGFFSMITTLPESGITLILLSNKGDFPRIELTNEMLKIVE